MERDTRGTREIDPVCKMQIIDIPSSEKASFNGRDYYFCSSICEQKFLKDPGHYIDFTPGRMSMRRDGP